MLDQSMKIYTQELLSHMLDEAKVFSLFTDKCQLKQIAPYERIPLF
jgi:hypothetical protein